MTIGSVGARTLELFSNRITIEESDRRIAGLEINEVVVFGLRRDERDWYFSAACCDSDGQATLRIDDNVAWIGNGVWDATYEGKSLKIWRESRDVVLHVEFDGEAGVIAVRKLRMSLANGFTISGDSDGFAVAGPMGPHGRHITHGIRGGNMRGGLIGYNVPGMGKWIDWVRD